MVSEPIIVCDSLVKIHRVADLEVQALQGLDLVVNRGELMGVVGVSGSGKSTLLNILGGLDRPTAGRVWCNGYNLVKLSDQALDRYRRSQVGFVWQQSGRNLIHYLSALENVELPMILAGIAGSKARRRAEELLSAVGLAERRHHFLHELSGGEQQLTSIAVALANQPKLLLADEPTGELDSTSARLVHKSLRELNQTLDLTILIVSHDPGLARVADRVVAIRDGKTVMETIAQPSAAGATTEEEKLEEWIVLDSAGRLQVPKECLDRYNIRGRARFELTQEGILIRGAPASPRDQTPQIADVDKMPVSEASWWKTLVNRLVSRRAEWRKGK